MSTPTGLAVPTPSPGNPLSALSLADRAKLVALELIRREVAKLPTAIAQNAARFGGGAGRGGGTSPIQDMIALKREAESDQRKGESEQKQQAKEAKDNSTLYQMGKALAGEFKAVLGPLGMFAQVLQSSASGLGLLAGAVKVAAASIAPILLPVAVVAATALLAVSDVIWQELLPNLEGFYALVLDVAIPAITILTESLIDAAGIVGDFAKWVDGVTGSSGPAMSATDIVAALRGQGFSDEQIGELGRRQGFADEDIAAAIAGRAGTPAEATRGEGITKNALSDVLRELRQSIGPTASISGLSQIGQSAQLAALNQSPFEARLLKMMGQMLSAMNRAANNTERRDRGRYETSTGGGGDFGGGDTGGGGDFGWGGYYGGGDF